MKTFVRAGAVTAAFAAAGLAACKIDSAGLGDETPLGIIQVFAEPDGQGAYEVRPTAEFVLTFGTPLPNSRSIVDSCAIQPYDPDPGSGNVPYISAGENVRLTIGDSEHLLLPRTSGQRILYELQDESVAIQPGEVVAFDVPGAEDGFPALTISSPIGPAFEAVTPIPAQPQDGENIPVSWTPLGDDSSKVEVSLRYASGGATSQNSQVLCDWPDTGTNIIPAATLTGWRVGDLREVLVTRYRTSAEVNGDAILFLLAVFDTTLVPAF